MLLFFKLSISFAFISIFIGFLIYTFSDDKYDISWMLAEIGVLIIMAWVLFIAVLMIWNI